MKTSAIVATILSASCLAATAFIQPAAPTTRSRGVVSMAQSKAIPFIEAPPALDGTLAGDFGFDPMGLTHQVPNLKYVYAAEIKHCRVAMLAFAGWVVQQFVHLPGEFYAEQNPLKAILTVPIASQVQIFGLIAAIELASLDYTYTADEPWKLGFDPLNFAKGKSAAQMRELQVKEIKNGRLAMIAIIGLFAQTLATGQAFL